MKKINNKFFEIMSKIADLFILNVVFLITCVPVFTIGAALAALYDMTGKLVNKQEGYIVKGYFLAFKRNFAKGTKYWLILLGIGVLAYLDIRIGSGYTKGYWHILQILAWMVLILETGICAYIFPILAIQERHKDGVKDSEIVKLAGKYAIAYLPKTVMMMILNAIFPVIIFWGNSLSVMIYASTFYVFIGCSLIAYVNSYMLKTTGALFDQRE